MKILSAKLHNVVCRVHQIYSHTFSLEDRSSLRERGLYNGGVCALRTEQRTFVIHVISSLQFILILGCKTDFHSRSVWYYVNQIIPQLNGDHINNEI